MDLSSEIVREGFFAYLEDINTPGYGFGLFGLTHILVLIMAVGLCVGLCMWCRRLSNSGQWVLLRGVMIVIILMELVQQISYPLIHGHYWLEHLPLHMCGLLIFISGIHAARPNKFTGELIYALGLPGAIAAMLFPDWTVYPIFHFYPLQSFAIHALHVAFGFMLLTSGNLRPDFRGLWRPVLFLAIIIPPIFAINRAVGTNFFFLNAGSEGSPLEILIDIFGNPGFILPYAGIIALMWVIIYMPWHLRRFNVKK